MTTIRHRSTHTIEVTVEWCPEGLQHCLTIPGFPDVMWFTDFIAANAGLAPEVKS